MSVKLIKRGLILIPCCMVGILVSACNNNTGGDAGVQEDAAKIGKLKNSVGIGYTLDGEVLNAGTQNWADMGWHLLTLTMTSAPVPQQSIAVNGVGATAGAVGHLANYGESVVVQDINCNDAKFANIGDTCSAYIKVSYDYTKYPSVKPVVPVNIYPNNWESLPIIIQASDWIQPAISVGVYRPVHPIETKYYSGSNVASNKNQYSILLMQNGLLKPINVTAVATPSNAQVFTLIHRTVAGNDPYYGTHSECSTTANAQLNQVNTLPTLNSECILVYKAVEYTTQSDVYDDIHVGSTANAVFPQYAGSYKLSGHYAVANPIPNQGFTTTSGSFPTPEPINQFHISYNFTPNKLPMINGSTGANLYLPDGTNVWTGEQILTSLSENPQTITGVGPQFPDGEACQNSGKISKGNFLATASGQVYQTQALTRQGQFNIALQINSDIAGMCPDPQNLNLNIPFSGYNQQIYLNNCLAMPLLFTAATLSGNCNGSWCSYNLALKINEINNINIPFAFPQPTTNIVASMNGSNNPITFAAPGGQTTYGKIGSQSSEMATSVTCDSGGTCNVAGDYSNGQSAPGMSYQLNLNPGDVLNNGLIEFTRSSGYQLNSFVIEPSEQ